MPNNKTMEKEPNFQPKNDEELNFARKIAEEQKTLENAKKMFDDVEGLRKLVEVTVNDKVHNGAPMSMEINQLVSSKNYSHLDEKIKKAIPNYDTSNKTIKELISDLVEAEDKLAGTIKNIESGTIEVA